MSTQTHDYGEPWKYFEGDYKLGGVERADGTAVLSDYDAEHPDVPRDFKRIASCVSALAGISDPEADIQTVGEVLASAASQKLSSELCDEERESADYETAYDMLITEARAALNLLTMKP